MSETHYLFTDLQPPPGGLRHLQNTLASESRRARWPGLRITAGVVALALLAMVWLLPSVIAQQQQTSELTAALRAATAPLGNGIRITQGAAIELPSGHAGVRLYLVQSLPPVR